MQTEFRKVEQIARHCPEFEPITVAQGYGISFLNGPMVEVNCQECTHWDDGNCDLYIEASRASIQET